MRFVSLILMLLFVSGQPCAASAPRSGEGTVSALEVTSGSRGDDHRRRGILIQAPSKPSPGSHWCFRVVPTGQNEGQVSAVIEVNGVLVTPTITQRSDGSFEICVSIPAGSAGGRVDVTVTCGTSVATRTFRIH